MPMPSRKLDSAMDMNFYHNFYFGDTNSINNSLNIPQIKNSVIAGRNKDRTINAHALYLEPTIDVDSTDNFQPRVGDSTGAVFGFRNRNFDVGDTVSSGVDFSTQNISEGRYFVKVENTHLSLTFKLVVDK
jgi:hypothetical protein